MIRPRIPLSKETDKAFKKLATDRQMSYQAFLVHLMILGYQSALAQEFKNSDCVN